MFNLLKAEFRKLKTSKIFYGIILLNLLEAGLLYSFSQNFRMAKGNESLSYLIDIQNSLILGILIGIFVCDFIISEFSSGYIKNLISYGHNRISIYISKSIVCYIGTIIIAFIGPLTMVCINSITNGFGEMITLNYIMSVTRIILIEAIIYVAIGSISVLIAFISRSINVSIGLIVGLDFTNRLFDMISIRNPSLEQIYNISIFSQLGIVISHKSGTQELIQAVVVSLITFALSTAVGMYTFNKADIK